MTSDAVVIRSYRPGDEHGILRAFNLVFGEVCGPSFVARDLAFWRWQFLDNPWGHRILVAAVDDGTIAAHYGGIVLPVTGVCGEGRFSQAVDSFVHPEWRHGLKRQGVFVRTARPWFEECAARGDWLTYGYPVPAAERIGRRLVDYEMLGVVDYLCLDLAAAPPAAPADVSVAALGALDGEVDALFARAAAGVPCLTRRDARYLQWRYAAQPRSPYEFMAARRAGALRGIAVLRPIHELVPGACTIADWIVPAGDEDAAVALIAAAAARGRAGGRRTLLAVFAASSAEHGAFRRRGFAVVPSANWLERRIAYRTFHPQMTGEWLRQHWWYTLGDSDLV